MADKLDTCPECGSGLRPHCPENDRCTWQVCKRVACAIVLDARRYRGFGSKGHIRWSA